MWFVDDLTASDPAPPPLDGFVSPADMNLAGMSALVAAGELVACATAPLLCSCSPQSCAVGQACYFWNQMSLPRLVLTRFLCPAGLGGADSLPQRQLPLPPARMSESGPASYSGGQAGWTNPVSGGPRGAATSVQASVASPCPHLTSSSVPGVTVPPKLVTG